MNIETLDKALNSITTILSSFKLEKIKNNQSLKNKYYSIIFLCQIFELSSDAKILIGNNSITSIPIILRSITDCLYSIWNMERNPEFIDSLASKSVAKEEKRQRLLNKAPKSIEYWDEWKKQFDNKNELTDYLKYFNIHKNEELYRLVYSQLSNYVHNDLLTLDRKFSSENNGRKQLKYDVGLTDTKEVEKYNGALVVSIYSAIISVSIIHGVNEEKYQKILDELVGNVTSSS